ncbi:hypothetical protein F5Y03DRAFT_405119 [Xylaria venustula]|nr:hypothetical protein F5Y03DRAFT_405119 [Xylaria venustula]
MDSSTASDSGSDSELNEGLSIESAYDNIFIKNLPVSVVWRNSHGENCSLPDPTFSFRYDPSTQKTLIRFQAATRLKKGPAKPCIYLYVRPDKIHTVTFVGSEDELGSDEELHRQARRTLGTSTYVLRFELRCSANFVVPTEHSFNFLRPKSKDLWMSWKTFARDTRYFFVHLPTKSLPQAQLLSFCQAASSHGTLRRLNEGITSLYGGRGGRVVDLHNDDEDNGARVGASIGTPSHGNIVPPAYDECTTAAPRRPVSQPLCLSPSPDQRRCHKRRRIDSSSSTDRQDSVNYRNDERADDRILNAVLRLQQTVDEAKAVNEAGFSKIMTKVEEIEVRFQRLEEDQRNMVDEVRTHMAPLWDELDARLQSQEDREHGHIRDVVEEVVDEVIKDKVAAAVDEHFHNGDEGQDLLHKVIDEAIYEETRDFLESQSFTGYFTLNESFQP